MPHEFNPLTSLCVHCGRFAANAGPECEVLSAIEDAVRREREPKDKAEKALFAAILRAYPEDANTKETCDCGDDDCDECPTIAQVESMVRQCEIESQ